MNAKTAPDWFFQNAHVKDTQGQYTILWFTTKEASDEIVSVTMAHRQTGQRFTVKPKDFMKRFKPLKDDEDIAPMERRKAREKISLL